MNFHYPMNFKNIDFKADNEYINLKNEIDDKLRDVSLKNIKYLKK